MSRRGKMTENILTMMENPKYIRNIALIGHIDHGKTTLSDSLLAEAGLLAESLAGEARVLDYLEEEQRRGITMKSANISLYYQHSLKHSKPFLINLVDTPGHLDFSGKVTRALRMADGVIVIVDSVEEVSSQTETVVKQALEEAVRPILFINKIDRLFKELKLDMPQIRDKFARIIKKFNRLIEMYGDDRAKSKWMVSAENGSVIFGCALHRWGFVIPQLISSGHDLEYFKKTYDNGSYLDLSDKFPVWECVLGSVVKFLPNPLVAQKYRISTIWSGDIDSKIGKFLINCDPKGPLIIGLNKVQRIKDRLIGTGRVFSGTLERGKRVWLLNQEEKSAINRISIFMGSRIESVDKIPAGNIAAIGGIKNVISGETIFDIKFKKDAKPFESVKYVSDPVVTIAVEPDMLRNLKKLEEILEEIKIEDPNISVEVSSDSGEVLLSGMGPLHLEIIADEVKKRGISIETSNPTSVFHESIQNDSFYHEVYSPNEKNRIKLKLKRLEKETVKYLRKVKTHIIENDYLRADDLPKHTKFSKYEALGIWNVDRFQNVVVSRLKEDTGVEYDENDKIIPDSEKRSKSKKRHKGKDSSRKISQDVKEQLIKGFRAVLAHGVLAREPLSELMIVIKDIELAKEIEDMNYFELSTMVSRAFKECFKEAKPILLEPIFNMMITTPEEYIGATTGLLNHHQAKILKINSDQFKTYIKAKISVRESIGFAQEIRGKTSGRVFWQNLFDHFAPIPEHQKDKIINDIKFRKGLDFF